MIILWWFICGALYAGIDYAYFQNKFRCQAKRDRIRDYFYAILVGISLGPIALTPIFFDSDRTRYGWRFIPYSKDNPMYKSK